jgi:hypothetical protein
MKPTTMFLAVLFSALAAAQTNHCFNTPEPVGPYTVVQHCDYQTGVYLSQAVVNLSTPNQAGSLLQVWIFEDNSAHHTFTVSDSNENQYIGAEVAHQMLSCCSGTGALFTAFNAKAGANVITVAADSPSWIAVVVREYQTVGGPISALDPTGLGVNVGLTNQPNLTLNTTQSGDLITIGTIWSDFQTPALCPGIGNPDYVPGPPPGGKLVVFDVYQANAGQVTECLNAAKNGWAMFGAAFEGGGSGTGSIVASAGTPQSTAVSTPFGTPLQATVRDSGGNLVSGTPVVFAAPSSGASGTFGGPATVNTDPNGVATAPTLTANATPGGYTVTATVASVATPASFSLTNTSAGGGSLAGAGTSTTTAVNLTTEGSTDWEHFGDGSPNRKANVTVQLSTYTVVGSGGVQTYNNDPRPVSWTDGTPTASSSNNRNGFYISGIGQGFSFTAPADSTQRTLVVHVGGYKSGGTLTVHLSDGSAADFTDTTAVASGQYDRNYTLAYQAASALQTLKVTWKMSSGTGNVTLNAVALQGGSAATGSIVATLGTPQSAVVNTAFTTALQATVTDSGGNPVIGAAVTFAAPVNGASGTFGGPATVNTDTNGVATAPTLTANATPGGYTVTATVASVATPASFNLTNTAAPTGAIVATLGTPQSAVVNTAFTTALQATVTDSGGNPVIGAAVTFAAPVNGASGTFGGPATVNTDTNGVATAPTLTANATPGGYTVTATVASVATPASFNLTNTSAGGGSLTGAGTSATTVVNLTTEGSADWEHFGDNSLNRKAKVTAQLSTYTVVGSGGVRTYNNDPRGLSWTDGTPTASSTNNRNGVYINGVGQGFWFTAPADTTLRTLVVHVGGYNSGGTLTAVLSDGSAPSFTDITAAATGQYDRNYTLTYQAASVLQTLKVTWKMASGGGNVTLNGAALH